MATLALLLVLNAGPAQAATRTVCAVGCTHTTIQAAIDTADNGDTILVTDGTFVENLVITRSLTLLGGYTGLPGDTTSRTPRATIIDGGVAGSVVYIGGANVTAIATFTTSSTPRSISSATSSTATPPAATMAGCTLRACTMAR